MVIERRRLELADRSIRGSVQPYHAAAGLKPKDAEAYLERCAARSAAMARAQVHDAVAELAGQGFEVAVACVLLGSGRPTPDLATTLGSHVLIHTAEGECFREALKAGCEACHLAVSTIRERELPRLAAAALRLAPDELNRRIAEMGKRAGPPWRQDEKLCAMAGWVVLAGPLE